MMNLTNVVLYGISSVSINFLKIIKSSNLIYNVMGLWDENPPKTDITNLLSGKFFNGKFEDIAISNNAKVLFLCAAPYTQYQLVNKLSFAFNHSSNFVNSTFPIIILIPPFSPVYSMDSFKYIKNQIFFAMPMRKLHMVQCIYNHLISISDNDFERSIEYAVLPSHWRLGELESVNIRLSIVNQFKNEYSWICEPESMGGGLLNFYCAGLIDLIYYVSGGYYLNSVTCLLRTFEDEIKCLNSNIRRVSSEDFVTIVGEITKSINSTDSNFLKRKPVVSMFISSELPQLKDNGNSQCDSQFKLTIELNGSEGSFKLDESLLTISWVPKISSQLNGKHDLTLENQGFSEIKHENTVNLVSNNVTSSENMVSSKKLDVDGNLIDIAIQKNRNLFYPRIEKNNGLTEVAYINLQKPTDSTECSDLNYSTISQTMKYAWSRWLTDFALALRSNASLTSKNSFVISGDHWMYIQNVLHASIKSSKMKCWVDVSTGERM